MKKGENRFQTNKGGIIKAPKPTRDEPRATVKKGNDLRNGTGNKK